MRRAGRLADAGRGRAGSLAQFGDPAGAVAVMGGEAVDGDFIAQRGTPQAGALFGRRHRQAPLGDRAGAFDAALESGGDQQRAIVAGDPRQTPSLARRQ